MSPAGTWACLLAAVVTTHPAVRLDARRRDASREEVVLQRGLQTSPSAGTDSGLYNTCFFEGDIVLDTIALRNAVSDEEQLWPDGSIIYTVSPSIGCPDSPQCKMLMRAMRHYHERTCVRFKEWTGEPHQIHIFFSSDEGACWSMVGRGSLGVQQLSLGFRCWYLGIVMHELAHAVGFWHEMTRVDRDQYIRVLWENIQNGSVDQFAIREKGDTLGQPFDYKSIMLYDEFAFAKKKDCPTVEVLQPNIVIGPIWNKTQLSEIDVLKISKLYQCNGSQHKPNFPRNVRCTFDDHTCGFKNGGDVVWKHRALDTENESSGAAGGYVFASHEVANATTPGLFVSVNLHPAAAADADAKGCARFCFQRRGRGPPQLKLFQALLGDVTDLQHDPSSAALLWTATGDARPAGWTLVEVPLPVTLPFKLIFESRPAFGVDGGGTVLLDSVDVLYSPCRASRRSRRPFPPTARTP